MRWWWVLVVLGCDDQAIAERDQQVADAAPIDARPVDAVPDAAADAAPVALSAAAGADFYAEVGAEVVLDGSGSTGAATYQWDFGDGRRTEAGPDALARVTYDRPGRYQATLTALAAEGGRDVDGVTVSVTWPAVFAPLASSSIVALPAGGVAVVVPDANQVTRVDVSGSQGSFPTCTGPRTLAVWGDELAVACPEVDEVRVGERRHVFRHGARPFGVVALGDRLAVSLQGTGELALLRREGAGLVIDARWPAVLDARSLATLPDGRVVIARWRSPDNQAQVVALDPVTGARETWSLAFDPQAPSDTEIGGVPGYLSVVVAPTGREVAVPSLQANVRHGPWFDGMTPAFDTILRGVVSFINLPENTEDFGARKQFDGRGFASAAVYSSRGDYLFVAMRGSRVIERLDRLTGNQAGTLVEAGYAVDGLALSADDRWLYADASLSREVRIWDVSDLRAVPLPAFTIRTVEGEPLDPQILRGKQLFNDGADPRLSRDGYVACAHCHLDADSDRLVWDFTARGEGLRNTISLLGRAGTGHGPVHWSANFDEIQDFEHDIRGPNGGTGLMTDEDFARANTPLGPPKAGWSEDLDALAAYVGTLATGPRSPFRDEEGRLRPDALRGEAVFVRLECGTCHPTPTYTDSHVGEAEMLGLHDVGTLSPSSGQRLGGALVGLDTPTLIGLFDAGPYLHDGSAPTLRDVLIERNRGGQHGDFTEVSPQDFADLEAFLLSLE